MNCDYEVVCSASNIILQFSQLSLVFPCLKTLFYQKQHLAFHSPSQGINFALRELMFCVHQTYIDGHGKSLRYKTNHRKDFFSNKLFWSHLAQCICQKVHMEDKRHHPAS